MPVQHNAAKIMTAIATPDKAPPLNLEIIVILSPSFGFMSDNILNVGKCLPLKESLNYP